MLMLQAYIKMLESRFCEGGPNSYVFLKLQITLLPATEHLNFLLLYLVSQTDGLTGSSPGYHRNTSVMVNIHMHLM